MSNPDPTAKKVRQKVSSVYIYEEEQSFELSGVTGRSTREVNYGTVH